MNNLFYVSSAPQAKIFGILRYRNTILAFKNDVFHSVLHCKSAKFSGLRPNYELAPPLLSDMYLTRGGGASS